jgi:hypothetical protein
LVSFSQARKTSLVLQKRRPKVALTMRDLSDQLIKLEARIADLEASPVRVGSALTTHRATTLVPLGPDRDLQPGDGLIARYRGELYFASIESDGKVRLSDGRLFSTVSGAGKAVRSGKATNGWDFWSRDNDNRIPDEFMESIEDDEDEDEEEIEEN